LPPHTHRHTHTHAHTHTRCELLLQVVLSSQPTYSTRYAIGAETGLDLRLGITVSGC
jgi:hypothetical protein